MPTLTRIVMTLWLALAMASAFGQQKEQGTVISDVDMYVAPDSTSQRLARVTRGRNVVLVMDRSTLSGKVWAHVLVIVDVNLAQETARQISGWIPNTFLITSATKNGDQIIFGEAVDSENQSQMRGGRRGGAQDALRLYYRLYEYFPNSPLAGEALWRSADLRWQQDKAEERRRPISREMDPGMRDPIDDQSMRELNKKFPHTKWSDLGSFDMIDNKLCGSWKGETKCPEKESELYEKYVREHPDSPKAAEALYNAAWRQAVLVDMYAQKEKDKSEKARKKSMDLAQEIVTRFPEGDWKPQAMELIYVLQQGIHVYDVANQKPIS